MSIDGQRDKEVVRIYTVEYYSVIKKKEILPSVTTWIDFEGIILNEMSDKERQILYDLIYIWNLKKQTNKNPNSWEKRSDLWLPEVRDGGIG